MKKAIVAAALMAFASDAAAQVGPQIDALNWCAATIPVAVDPSSAPLRRGLQLQRTTLAGGGSYSPGDVVATLDVRLAPTRTVVEAGPETGLRPGDILEPFWIQQGNADFFRAGAQNYCRATGASEDDPRLRARGVYSRPYVQGICLAAIDGEGVASGAFAARFVDPALNDRETPPTGEFGPGFRRGEPFATLAAAAAVTEIQMRTLRLGAVHVYRNPAIGSRHAFNSISVEFQVEGFPLISRRLYDPLRVEDGWLVVRAFNGDGSVQIVRMADAEWAAFRGERCAEAARAPNP